MLDIQTKQNPAYSKFQLQDPDRGVEDENYYIINQIDGRGGEMFREVRADLRNSHAMYKI